MGGLMKKLEVSLGVLAAALSWGAALPAAAQEGGDNFNRDRNVSVRERPKPEYDAAGIRMGGMWLYPELSLGAEFTDNVFATSTDTEEDTILHVRPEAELRSRWTTHELVFGLAAPMRFHTEFDDADTTDVIVSADGRLDVYRDFNLFGGVTYGDMTEDFASSPTSLPLAEPIEYTQTAGHVGFVKAFNRLRISGEARQSVHDYEDGVLFNNTPIEQDDRDRTITQAGLRADYAISPLTALFIAVGANERDYDLDPPDAPVNRDSEGYEALVGANFDLTRLMRGEIGVGYLAQEYDEPGIGETTGLAVRTHVEWYPDELVTVSFGAAREIGDAGAVGASSYIANNASFGLDYEYRRHIILGLGADYSFDDYSGIDREDTRWDVVLKLDYLIDRGAAIYAEAGHYEQDSDGLQLGREYDMNRAVIGIRLRR